MIDFLLAPQNVTFAAALGLFLFIGLVQFLSLLFGASPFDFLDGILPEGMGSELELPDAPVGMVDSVLSMLKIGKVPIIFTGILFLFLYSQTGYYGQYALLEFNLPMLPSIAASAAAFVITLPMLRVGNSVLYKVLPRDESAAFSSETYVGRIAVVAVGKVTFDRHAEARVVGPDAKTHYVQVIADNAGASFAQGEHVLIVGRRGEALFTVIKNPNPLLES